jgi:hypothetical protein
MHLISKIIIKNSFTDKIKIQIDEGCFERISSKYDNDKNIYISTFSFIYEKDIDIILQFYDNSEILINLQEYQNEYNIVIEEEYDEELDRYRYDCIIENDW